MVSRSPANYLFSTLAILSFLFHYKYTNSDGPGILTFRSKDAANSTLGFGGIYVVSQSGSPYRDSLIKSANVTWLDFTIPTLYHWTDQQIANFRNDTVEREKSGSTNASAKLWLSHHAVLRQFLKSGLETALVLDDNVQWDERLRAVQMPAAAAALRLVLPPVDEEDFYWGHPDDWDFIHIGHCGEEIAMLRDELEASIHVLYHDEMMPESTCLELNTTALLKDLGVPEETRILYKSRFPRCAFGYALTRATAKKLVEVVAPVDSESHSWPYAYDRVVAQACRSKGLRCFTVSPELFHTGNATNMTGDHPSREKAETQQHRPRSCPQ